MSANICPNFHETISPYNIWECLDLDYSDIGPSVGFSIFEILSSGLILKKRGGGPKRGGGAKLLHLLICVEIPH